MVLMHLASAPPRKKNPHTTSHFMGPEKPLGALGFEGFLDFPPNCTILALWFKYLFAGGSSTMLN